MVTKIPVIMGLNRVGAARGIASAITVGNHTSIRRSSRRRNPSACVSQSSVHYNPPKPSGARRGIRVENHPKIEVYKLGIGCGKQRARIIRDGLRHAAAQHPDY